MLATEPEEPRNLSQTTLLDDPATYFKYVYNNERVNLFNFMDAIMLSNVYVDVYAAYIRDGYLDSFIKHRLKCVLHVSSYVIAPRRTIIIQTFVFSTDPRSCPFIWPYLLSFGVGTVNAHLSRPIRSVGTIRLKAILFSPRWSPLSNLGTYLRGFYASRVYRYLSFPYDANRSPSRYNEANKTQMCPRYKSVGIPWGKARLELQE